MDSGSRMADGTGIAAAVLRWFDDNTAQGILVTDRNLDIQVWNQWMVDATGILRDAAVRRPLLEVVPSLVERGLAPCYTDALGGEVKVLSHVFHRFVIPTTN